jgi:hypothetical protein
VRGAQVRDLVVAALAHPDNMISARRAVAAATLDDLRDEPAPARPLVRRS